MPELLLELFSEEIPARMQAGAAGELDRLAKDGLAASDLTFSSLRTFAGPRRLTLVVEGLPREQATRREERRGPRVGAPEAAIAGFLRNSGSRREDLIERDGAYFAEIATGGRLVVEVIGEIIPEIVRGFPWPKSMIWGDGDLRWVRPLRRILCVLDRAVVPIRIGDLESGDLAEGHRVMGQGRPFRARDFDEYREALAGHFVVLEADERKRRILEGSAALCRARGLHLIEDQGLAEEVAGLAEWPVPLIGDIDRRFLDLPPEVIRTSMRTHQRYFAVGDAAGALAPHFITVANLEARDGGASIAAGAARVLAARLEDARFFWNEDRASRLEVRLDRLKGVTFHAKLGTLFERAERMEMLARNIAPLIGAEADLAGEAARLAKADLATAMVGEFPELQGVMGGYYAAAEGLDPAISVAIREHYRPLGPRDGLPAEPVAVAVALADKLDTLVGFFEIGEKPTGSKDPFALRRMALGIVRISLAQDRPLALRPLIALAGAGAAASIVSHVSDSRLNRLTYREAVAAFGDPAGEIEGADALARAFRATAMRGAGEALTFWRELRDTAWIEEVLTFLLDRLRTLLRDEGRSQDVCEAIIALGDDDLRRIAERVRRLDSFLATSDGANLLTGYRRANSILEAEAKKGPLPSGPRQALGEVPAEEANLQTALETARPRLDAALKGEDFAAALAALALLRAPVDAFFDKVLVNSQLADERDNRLRLLVSVREAMGRIADFSRISGSDRTGRE